MQTIELVDKALDKNDVLRLASFVSVRFGAISTRKPAKTCSESVQL